MRSVIPFALFAVGCVDLGERADSGVCPAGQTCSDDTPAGLEFDGTHFDDLLFDAGVHATAVGGTQDIFVADHATGAALTRPFTAQFEDASGHMVLGQRVTDIVGSSLAIEAEEAGSALLALRARAGGGLLDRLGITAKAVDRLSLRPSSFDGELLAQPGGPIAAWSGAPVRLAIALEATDGTRLVDKTLAATGTGLTVRAWDAIELTATADLAIEVSAGSLATPRTLMLPVVAAATGVAIVPLEAPKPMVDNLDIFCFHATADAGEIVGAPWTFAVVEGAATISNSLFRNCQSITYTTAGRLVVSAGVPGRETQLVLQVAPKNAARVAPPVAADKLPSLGERAATFSVDN